MPDPSEAFNSALANEQFGLQAVSGGTISESGSRAGLYFSSLSSGLVAVGFASSTPEVLRVFAFTVLPTVFLLGCFTIVRLVDTAAQNIVALQRVEQIRRYWASLDPRGAEFFPADTARNGSRGVRYSSLSVLFTTATMVATVNSVLAAAIAALVLTIGLGLGLPGAVPIAVVIGLLVLLAFLQYQRRRLRTVDRTI